MSRGEEDVLQSDIFRTWISWVFSFRVLGEFRAPEALCLQYSLVSFPGLLTKWVIGTTASDCSLPV